jgi:hypothetical protein
MKKQKKSILVLAVMVAFVATGLFLPGLVEAGDLEPSASPGSTMHTLEDIYNKVSNIGAANVEKTRQTGCWNALGTSETCAGTGQDGELQKGVSWPVPRFTDNGDGTVTDNLTGLIWLQQANYNSTSETTGIATWSAALTFCNALYSGICGLNDGSVAGDWRLPNIKELQSLIDFSQYNPALPSGHLFTDVQSTDYWSSTTYAGGTVAGWLVHMNDGDVGHSEKTYSNYVWPVRGGY